MRRSSYQNVQTNKEIKKKVPETHALHTFHSVELENTLYVVLYKIKQYSPLQTNFLTPKTKTVVQY